MIADMFCNISQAENNLSVLSISKYNMPIKAYPVEINVAFVNNESLNILINKQDIVFVDNTPTSFWNQMLCFDGKQLRLDASFFLIELNNHEFLLFDNNREHEFLLSDSNAKQYPIRPSLTFCLHFAPPQKDSYLYFFKLDKLDLGFQKRTRLLWRNVDENEVVVCHRDDSYFRTPISIFMTKIQSFLFSYIRRNVKEIKEIKQYPAPSITNL